jgi:hypothetical protein
MGSALYQFQVPQKVGASRLLCYLLYKLVR